MKRQACKYDSPDSIAAADAAARCQRSAAALPFSEQLQKFADDGRADAPVDSAEDSHLSELELLCADAEERCVLASASPLIMLRIGSGALGGHGRRGGSSR